MLMEALSPRDNSIKMSSECLPSRESHHLYPVSCFVPPGFYVPAVVILGPKRNTLYQEHTYVQLTHLIA